eukprot:Awhi_evm1s11242
MFSSRDRNGLHGESTLEHGGKILSSAIIEDKGVRKKVLDYFCKDMEHFVSCNDVADGKFISKEARKALYDLKEEETGGRKCIFLEQTSNVILQIQKADDLKIVKAHGFLHNHVPIVEAFNVRISTNPLPIPEDSWFKDVELDVKELLGVNEIFLSSVVLPSKMVGFFKVSEKIFITSLSEVCGPVGNRITEDQELSIHQTLNTCDVNLLEIIRLIRLFHGIRRTVTGPTSLNNNAVSLNNESDNSFDSMSNDDDDDDDDDDYDDDDDGDENFHLLSREIHSENLC